MAGYDDKKADKKNMKGMTSKQKAAYAKADNKTDAALAKKIKKGK
jgi:hypothetical protein